MKFFVAVTDTEWFNYLSQLKPEEVNFWQPGGRVNFNIIEPGAPFLFKLKSPINAIGGVGFFVRHSILPISVAWQYFGNKNGVKSSEEFISIIQRLRAKGNDLNVNPNIGCIVLTNPVFFKKNDWISVPVDWKPSIVQGKSYSMDEPVGSNLWEKVEVALHNYKFYEYNEGRKSQLWLEPPEPKYGNSVLTKVRLGQDAFRLMVTEAYSRKCAITSEKTLPVLEAAHIKQYAKSGPNFISNGILLRADIHKLFDGGYITINNELKVVVSKRIREEFDNGKEYYKYHGNSLASLPQMNINRPSSKYLNWHNTSIYKG